MGYDYDRYEKYSISVARFAAKDAPSWAKTRKYRRAYDLRKSMLEQRQTEMFFEKRGLGDAYRYTWISLLSITFFLLAVGFITS